MLNEAFLAKPAFSSLTPGLERIERSSACIQSIKSWFDVFENIPLQSYVGFTFFYMCDVAYNLLTLVRFSTLEDPAWDRGAVRKDIDILGISDKLAENYEGVAKSESAQIINRGKALISDPP